LETLRDSQLHVTLNFISLLLLLLLIVVVVVVVINTIDDEQLIRKVIIPWKTLRNEDALRNNDQGAQTEIAVLITDLSSVVIG
jgi:hypothetical protein